MAAGWEMGFSAMGLADVAPPAAYTYGLPSTDTLRIDDLPSDAHLPFLNYVPSEEAAELEWLSQFVDDSFSDMPYPSPFIAPSSSGTAVGGGLGHPMQPHSSSSSANSPTSSSTTTTSDFPAASPRQKPTGRRKAARGEEGGARRCSHCQSERTPQWRTGPMGPKTLCNACGVRYKSGRLVPEYRPAASPTFVLTQHSNSHRKVVELRRQKELLLGGIAASAGGLFGDYEVC